MDFLMRLEKYLMFKVFKHKLESTMESSKNCVSPRIYIHIHIHTHVCVIYYLLIENKGLLSFLLMVLEVW